jgi:hypothetical protein
MENEARWKIEQIFMLRMSMDQMRRHPFYIEISKRVQGKDMEIVEMEFQNLLQDDLLFQVCRIVDACIIR